MRYADELLIRLFPFGFELDNQLRATITGPSLAPLVNGQHKRVPLLELLDIEHPHLPEASFEALRELPDQVYVLRLKVSGLRMRGQMVLAPTGDRLNFVGSPWFSDSEQLTAHGLRVSDFAPHDSALEHVILLQSQKQQLEDLRRLNQKLQQSIDNQYILAVAEENLLNDLDIAADLHMRIRGQTLYSLRVSNGTLQRLTDQVSSGTPLSGLPETLRDWVQDMVAHAPEQGINRTCVPLPVEGETRILDVRTSRAGADVMGTTDNDEVIIIARDVTADKHEHQTLFQTLEQATDAVVTVADDNLVTFFNRAAEQLWGLKRAEVLGRNSSELSQNDSWRERQLGVENWIRAIANNEAQRGEVLMRTAAGGARLCSVSVSTVNTHSSTVRTAFVRDITEERELEQRIEHQARYDPLTGLPNRSYFRQTLEQHIDELDNTDARLGLMLIDIDDFKQINDLMGHQAGDVFLRTIAERIGRGVRESDIPCRLGGDEFAVMVFDPKGAVDETELAERLLGRIRQPMRLGQVKWNPSASIGTAVFNGHDTASDLLRHADLAMYEGKYNGKGTVTAFVPKMQSEALEKITIQENLSHAIDNGEIYPVFQPIVDLHTARPIALEALARWEDSSGRKFTPDRFIPLAEGSDLIINLGECVLRQSLTQLAALLKQAPDLAGLRLNVNISPRHFIHPKLVGWLDELLSGLGLPASCLVLELTEHVLISEPQRITNVFAQLHELGVRLSLDDFGTGYSSLSYLNKYEFDQLKIDRTFVTDLATRPRSAQLAHMIITLAEVLDLEVIAEGIENAQQRDLVLQMGGRLGQGYYYYQPQRMDTLSVQLTDINQALPAAAQSVSGGG